MRMGRVSILTGRSGSGKSRYLRSIAAELIKKGERVLYIVPEQFTFETERALAETMGCGLWDADVFSFTSLARRVLNEFGERRTLMSEQGRLMVIRKCADELAPKLISFGRVYHRGGFTGECARFFIEAKRAGIEADALMDAANEKGTDTPLGAKLHDLALLYGASEAYMARTSLDAEESLRLLSELLPKSELGSRHVIIDGFDMISKRLYGAIAALIDAAPHVTVALRIDLSPECRDKAVFSADRRILDKILSICEERGITPDFITPDGEQPRHASAALRHLEREGFAFPYNKFDGEANGAIELFAATDVKAEVTAAAEKAQRLIDEGYRYRDIAIIASDTDKYLEPMMRALRERHIPFFTDAKRKLASYAASEATLFALRAAGGSYLREDMLALVKTGLCGVNAEQAEIFENYALARGIRGSAFKSPFGEGAPAAAEEARGIVMGPLEKLSEALKDAPTAAEKVRALYQYTVDISLREQLTAEAERLKAQGRLERADETAQVYNLLITVMEQLHAILGDAKISNRKFTSVYKEGIDAYEVGVIPSAADQLLLGSLGRSKARSIRALIILGAANGHFPAVYGDDGMIDDEERASLAQMGLGEMPSTAQLNDKEFGDAYGAVTKPTDKLWLSYTMGSGSDTATPCELMDRIADMFGDVSIKTDIEEESASTAPSAYSALIKHLRTGVENGHIDARAGELYAALHNDDEYARKLASLPSALFPSVSAEPLGEDAAHRLYGARLGGGITSIEKFNGCPFKHFASVGLKLTPRREYRERKADEGLFCHEAMSLLTKELIAMGKGDGSITNDRLETLLDSILPKLIAQHNNGVLMDTARGRAAGARLIRRVKATAYAVVEQLRRGEFSISGTEVEFGTGKRYPELILELPGGGRYILSGRIDRIDSCTSDSGERFVRVIDYKSESGSAFDCADIADGKRLQLPLYIAAIEAAGAAERAAGMYYLPVHEGIINSNGKEDDFGARILKEFRLRGACLNDAKLIELGGGEDVQPTARSGWRLSEEQLKGTVSFAVDKAKQTAYKIAKGYAQAYPLIDKRGYDECSMCDYNSVCGFDATLPCCKYRRASIIKKDDFLEEVSHAQMDR